MLGGSVMPLYSETGYKFLQAGTVLSQKNHSCGWLNLGTVIVMVMLNGILCSFSAPLNGCPLNGTVIGVRHKFLLFAEMARYLNVWMSFWRTHTCQNTHTHRIQGSFFSRQNLCKRDLGVKAVPESSARPCPAPDSARVFLYDNEHLCKMGTNSNVSLSWRMLEKRA